MTPPRSHGVERAGTPAGTFFPKPPLPFRMKESSPVAPDWSPLWETLCEKGPAILLESAGPSLEPGRWCMVAGMPTAEFSLGSGIDGSAAWDFLDSVGLPEEPFQPFPGCLSRAWFGALSYEFGSRSHLTGRSRWHRMAGPFPGCSFFKPSVLGIYDRSNREIHWYGEEPPRPSDRRPAGSFRPLSFVSRMDRKGYERRVGRVKDYIRSGDVYQVNLARSFGGKWEGSPAALYRTLRELNPAPFMGLYRGRGFTLISSSPERLVWGRGDRLETRPIAGTRPRGGDSGLDLRLKAELTVDPKERAEHLMLVDLARNDLGRVARYGTVEVRDFARVEPYARVQHLVSTVTALRRSDRGTAEVLRSLFPGGTITGCPKIRCMEIIEELEGEPRGFYTGSLGYVAPGPCLDLNILIRSLVLGEDGTFDLHAGAGIVWDSDPAREEKETLHKAEALARALGTSLIGGD